MSHISNSTNAAYKTVLNQAEECDESQPEIALTRESLNTQKVYQEKREAFQGTEKPPRVVPWNIIAQDFEIEEDPKEWKEWCQHSSADYPMSRLPEGINEQWGDPNLSVGYYEVL